MHQCIIFARRVMYWASSFSYPATKTLSHQHNQRRQKATTWYRHLADVLACEHPKHLIRRVCFGHSAIRERLLFVGCLTSHQHASVSQGPICSDNFTCCHNEIDQTFHLTQTQYTDTGPTSPSTDPITPGAWQGSHWSANV